MVKYCTACGVQLSDEAAFCSSCGNRQFAAKAPRRAAPAALTPSARYETREVKRPEAKSVVFVCIAAVLLIAGVFALWQGSTQLMIGQGLSADANTVGLWHFNEGNGTTTADASGNKNDGAITGTTSVDGKFGMARNFAAGDRIAFKLPSIYEGTLEMWVKSKTGNPVATSYDSFFSSTVAPWNNPLLIWTRADQTNPNKIIVIWNGNVNAIISGYTLNDTNWHYLALTWDGTTTRLFIEGVEDANSPAASTGGMDPGNYWLGATICQPSRICQSFEGAIDEVRISNVARSATEIKVAVSGKAEVNLVSLIYLIAGAATIIAALILLLKRKKWWKITTVTKQVPIFAGVSGAPRAAPAAIPGAELPYFEKVKAVLLRPSEFFATMPTAGGYGDPIKFAVINYAIMGIILGIVMAVLMGFVFSMLGAAVPFFAGFAALGAIAMLILFPIMSVVSGIISLFIGAAIYYILIKLFGGQNTYEATFRVLSATSAIAILSWIPIVNFFTGIYGIYLTVVGLSTVHGISKIKALIVILIPVIVVAIVMLLVLLPLLMAPRVPYMLS